MPSFIDDIAKKYSIPEEHPVVRYLHRKTNAVKRDSKARRSLGNLYALFVLAQDYVDNKFEGSRFTDLLARMKAMPFGGKLQNHPLDNRLNDEFSRQYDLIEQFSPVQNVELDQGGKIRRISKELLEIGGADPHAVASFIVDSVNMYVQLITERQEIYLEKLRDLKNDEDFVKYITSAFDINSDARLFEIVSYALLKEHIGKTSVYFGTSKGDIKEVRLELFRSGRTNANDGGIDFVLKPIGSFYQVTETLDFKKYFLDFEKVNRFPITFVIKTSMTKERCLTSIKQTAKRSGLYADETIEMYMSLFEDVFTLNELNSILQDVKKDKNAMNQICNTIEREFLLEYNMLD